MDISIQYLEDTPARARISAAEARGRLHGAFQHLKFNRVLLGWDLAPALIHACAEECGRHGSELYLWLPILTGHRSLRPHPTWRVVALDGKPAGPPDQAIEFTFMCPNQPEVLEGVLKSLDAALASGGFQGVFLDRIRLPSPSLGLTRNFGCFCEVCRAAAARSGFDLIEARQVLLEQLATPEGRRSATASLMSPPAQDEDAANGSLRRLLDFRLQSNTAFVKSVAQAVRARRLKVGLDCFAPTLTRMVGQDLGALAGQADWIKVMTYARAFGHAALPFEVIGLTDWLIKAGGITEDAALECIARAAQWTLPGSREVIRNGGLPASILTEELRRGRSGGARRLLAGIELLEIPDVSRLDRHQIQIDAQAVHAGAPDGVVLSWDLWHMPPWRLELAASLYG